ncbi:hypothetical protein J2T57_001923 [Natronocella acetinitrilica]|uniref:Uncharacterized protein n=1 Tax=Natronocella acetinitrilica TaxID=414046 RepID=A0AAE3G2S9_9GAMM|nr:hypothetical protein [Natronocella acetinitrilica]MCP1674785.1 hypothetical protein [Natronocella acetinitrilica]
MASSLSLANVIDSDFRLAALETNTPERVFEVFKRLTLTTGRAVYGWSPDDGLYRLGTERIFIPQTRSIGDALGYISASRHYGIYLLQDITQTLEKPSILRAFERITEKDDNVRRLVILLGETVTVPEHLAPQVAMIRHSVPQHAANG